MVVQKKRTAALEITLFLFVLFASTVGENIETYEDLCKECHQYRTSYRLRGWFCWTACGSQPETAGNFKEQEKIAGNTYTAKSTTKRTKGNIKPVNTAQNVRKTINQTNKQGLESKNINRNKNRNDTNWTLRQYLIGAFHQILEEPSSFIEVFKKARCIFPKDIDSITRALLLQQCLSRNQAQGNETVCYEELGCFPMERPWVSLLRPFPSPHTPDQVDVRLYLYTRAENTRFDVPLWPQIDLNGSDFNPTREKTIFITHGFASNGNSSWLSDMKDAYLSNSDVNVFLVDWGKGASLFNYLQVASNTRIVGAEVARFTRYLLNLGVDPKSLHLIGHSLGSHISSYIAKNIADMAKPGRITALDPAQPGFEIESRDVRLNEEDAEFVDVLHTDAKPFIPFVGFGMLLPVGHVDFYLNGGTNQPGCLTNINIGKIKSIYDLADIPVEILSQWVSCSHGRSYEVFIEALHPENSCLWARKIPFFTNLIKVTAMGALRLLDPFIESWDGCTKEYCTAVGLSTPNLQARGIFALSTTTRAPFCVTDEERDRKMKNILSLGLLSIGSKIKDGIAGLISAVTLT